MMRLRVASCGLGAPRRLGGQLSQLATRNAVTALFLLLLALPAHAALTTSSLTGRIAVTGGPAANVTVTATSSALQHPRTTITNARGVYFLDALPPGEYDVTFSRAGLTTLTRRAVVQLGRVARADAVLEPSEDEESVTSTATTPSAADTTAVTTHFDDRTLEFLPRRREVFPITEIAPRVLSPVTPLVDDVFIDHPNLIGEESIEQMTVVREAVPADLPGKIIAARTRSGGEQFFLSLRDTLTNKAWIDDRYRAFSQPDGTQHHLEAAGGGRIVPGRLWFFAGAWLGEQVDVARNDARGALIKLTASPAAAHTVTAAYVDAQSSFSTFPPPDSTTAVWLRYTGVAGPRFASEVLASRGENDEGFLAATHSNVVHLRGSYVLGDHVIAAGASHTNFPHRDFWTLFASDRWSTARWTVHAGLRHESLFEATLPRVAVAYDLRGDARRALTASYGEYREFADAVRIATLGYAMTLGATGSVRFDLVRRHQEQRDIDEAVIDARYRLFDRFEVGGNYSWARDVLETDHIANAWIGVELPLFGHEFGVTYVQRLAAGKFAIGRPERDAAAPADLALRYTIPVARTRVTLALDSVNVFGTEPVRARGPRATRLWVRLRL